MTFRTSTKATPSASNTASFAAKMKSGALAKAFQVPVKNGLTARHSFLIDEAGRIKKVWREVKPQGHAEEILAAAKS